jgi:MFS family permease
VDNFGVSEATAAVLVAIIPAVALFAALLGGYLYDRIGGVPVLILVGLMSAPLVYLMGVAPNIPVLVAVLVALGFVQYIRMPVSEAYLIGQAPQNRRSTILGIYFFAGMEVSGLLVPLIGNLIDRYNFYWSFTITGAALAVIVVVCSLLLWRNKAWRSSFEQQA